MQDAVAESQCRLTQQFGTAASCHAVHSADIVERQVHAGCCSKDGVHISYAFGHRKGRNSRQLQAVLEAAQA